MSRQEMGITTASRYGRAMQEPAAVAPGGGSEPDRVPSWAPSRGEHAPAILAWALLGVACLCGPVVALQEVDPNSPGVLEPVLSATTGVEVRIPNTDQAAGDQLLNLVGSVSITDLEGFQSLTGHPITDTRSPNLAMRDALGALSVAAAEGRVDSMQAAAAELESILLGTTQGSVYDGFAMLNYNRGAYVPDHVPGEYKMKVLTDSGLTAPGMDGEIRRIWEISVNFLWYDGQFDSDTFLLRVPVEAHPFDTLRVHFRIYSLETEDFSPTVVMLDHRLPGSVSFPFKGLDSVWVRAKNKRVTQLSVDFPPLRLLRGIYTWGWREHPPRIHFMQPVFEMVNAYTGLVELEPQGRSYAERNQQVSIDDIGDAAPEKKMWQVVQAVLGGATPASVSAMLGEAAVAPRGTWQEWADLAIDQLQIPAEAWDVLAAEGLAPGDFGPYRFITVYMNNELYGQGALAVDQIEGFEQGEMVQVKLVNLDHHMHYFRNVDFGPKLHDDIAAGSFSSGSHSFEITNFKPTYGAPKVAEMQWRAGWGFRPHLDVLQQQDVFPRDTDRALRRHYYDGSGTMRFGWRYSAAMRGGDFPFSPPPFIIGTMADPSAEPLREDHGQPGLVIGRHTEGYGVAKMCRHLEHPLGGFCQTDISAFNPNGAKNVDTDGDGMPDVLWFPPFLRNPDPVSGGDIIPPTMAWSAFLWLNPANGSLQIEPGDPSQGHWVDRTYGHGAPVPPGEGLSASIESPRASGQIFYMFDDLFHDNCIFSPHATYAPTVAPAVNLGHGTAGGNGKVPFLSMSGSLATFGSAILELHDAAPNASAHLILSLAAQPAPFKGGTLLPTAPLFSIAFVTNADGALSLPVQGGGGLLHVYIQVAVVDAGVPPPQEGLSLSNALDVILQP